MNDSPENNPRRNEKVSRRSAVRALLFLVVALVAASSAAFLLTRYLDARTAAMRVPTVKVVVADADLPIATIVSESSLKVVDWPAGSAPQGIATDPKQLDGRVVHERIAKGEPVLLSKLATPEAGYGLASLLAPGQRAMAVKVDEVVGVAGFLHPGDHVDVIVTMRPSDSGSAPFVSKAVLQNLKVLAVGKELEHRGRELEKATLVTVATLEVDEEEAERLALAAAKGHVVLVLRPSNDDELVETQGVVPGALLGAPPPSSETRVVAKSEPRPTRRAVRHARPATAPAAAEPGQVVEILRGDLFEKRDFARKEAKP
ncbi:Flp pilus assembly protein CpaB [Anaeromyxobacter paludicola]|uniref:SAF domain-containing protein n=1 Tax=Anaeromyxobacter paludicola TaxID=2918171 RepID=A0ABN6N8H2_9BACT|nr:Flp pilus assembly protein CpaB [Anaeromyxobacter paludicola]BDG08493.1 hypothetical protein AMPC_16060 [Anaeromyxobacter paludicola]